jgi:CubicO group peptidase (beta-lactamase class C family)
MSKIVTISVALDLVEDGIIKLNDPVTKYIPEFKNLRVAVTEDGRPLSDFEWNNANGACPFKLVPMDSVMTVLHLINHQAGFYYAMTSIPCLDSLVGSQNLLYFPKYG